MPKFGMKRKRFMKRKMKRKVSILAPWKKQNSMQLFHMKVEAWVPIAQLPAGGGGYNDACYVFPLNFPGNYRNPSGTYGSIGAAQLATDLAYLMGAFDEYKVTQVRARVIPSELDTKTAGTAPDIGDYPSLVYHFNDNDDSSQVATENDFLNAGTKPFQFTFHETTFKYLQPREKRKTYLNCGGYNSLPTLATVQNIITIPSPYSSLKLMFPRQQFAPAAGGIVYYYGRIYITWYLTFRGLNSVSAA